MKAIAGGYNLSSLPIPLRRLAFADCFELDLKGVLLATIANEWSVTSIQRLLATGHGWNAILDGLNLHGSRASLKEVVKSIVYSIVYGRQKNNLEKACREELGKAGLTYVNPVELAEAIGGLDIVEELLDKREHAYAELRRQGSYIDAFGFEVPVDYENAPSKRKAIMTAYSNKFTSIEFKLLEPVVDLLLFELTKTKPQFYAVLWQHDGFTLRVTQQSRAELHIRRLQEAVAKRAKEMGIHTSLEVQWAPGDG